MISSGLQAAAAILVSSFGIAMARLQQVRLATERLRTIDHGEVIGRDESCRKPGPAGQGVKSRAACAIAIH